MRKIEEAIHLFWYSDSPRKFYNTEISIEGNVTKMYLHNNLIAIKLNTIEEGKNVSYIGLTTKSWVTATTRSRLNCLDYNLHFYIKGGQLKVENNHRVSNIPNAGFFVFRYEDGKYEELGFYEDFKLVKDIYEDTNIFRFAYR